MQTKAELREIVKGNLEEIVGRINFALLGKDLKELEPVLARLGRGKRLPHWFAALKKRGSLPNLDGKTIGSIVEMLFVAILEVKVLAPYGINLRINPARGVDIPDLDLGVKSPSTNFCTSEPFFSAYERLLGSENDAIVFLTDYQEKKKSRPFHLQITKYRYLKKSQIADRKLCNIARNSRDKFGDTAYLQKIVRFLSFVNQSDWLAKQLLQAVDEMSLNKLDLNTFVASSLDDFNKKNSIRLKRDKILIPTEDIEVIEHLLSVRPSDFGIIDAADNWVLRTLKDAGRAPNDNEWQRFLKGPLDGEIGMSFALQWRYNFGAVFGVDIKEDSEEIVSTFD